MNRLVVRLPKLKPKFVVQAFSEVYDWGLIDLKIPDVHKTVTGAGIKICIVDSGASQHFEVQHAILKRKNFTLEKDDFDHLGHSTFVSGIIAAQKNDDGIIGVAPGAQLLFAKAMDKSGTGTPAALVNSIHWAIEQKVDIISISAGFFVDFKPLYEAVKAAYAKNIIVVAAAGNSGERYYDIAFPARYNEVIGVAAYDRNRQTASFSSRGVNVKCAMPGVDIYSTWLDQQYCRNNGTSFAAPMLSGICALILAGHRTNPNPHTPCDTPAQMLEHLKKYAIPMGASRETGIGTINVVAAIGEGN
jgi:subtilisin family serine protease